MKLVCYSAIYLYIHTSQTLKYVYNYMVGLIKKLMFFCNCSTIVLQLPFAYF